MFSLKKVFFSILFVFLAFSSCYASSRISVNIQPSWKYFVGDDVAWSQPDYDDHTWKTLDQTFIDVGDTHYVWVRANVAVPLQLSNSSQLWIGIDHINAAAEVYADGVFIGSRGMMPPKDVVRVEENTDICIPLSAVHDGSFFLR